MGTFSLDYRLINQFVLKKFTFIVKKKLGDINSLTFNIHVF